MLYKKPAAAIYFSCTRTTLHKNKTASLLLQKNCSLKENPLPIFLLQKTTHSTPPFLLKGKKNCSSIKKNPAPAAHVFYHKTYSPNGLKREKRNWAAKIFWAGPTLQSPPPAQHKGRLHSNISVRVHAG